MQPWRIVLAYDGSRFHGWQVQPGLPTIQGTLADALRHITGETVLPQGSGRTDTGVHALGQVASFALQAAIPPENLHRALNRVLPPAIRVLRVEHAATGFHARHSAIGKTYEYRIFCRHRNAAGMAERICPPFLAPYLYDFRYAFQPSLANRAAAHVVGEHDFTSFAATDPDRTARLADPDTESKGNVRRITASRWTAGEDGSMYLYRVTGSGFLHHMVRNLVGTFLDAACGRTDPDEVPRILKACRRAAAGPTAPARGLFLVEVEY